MEPQHHDDAARLRQEVHHLRLALVNRDLIGQAKGILMERHGISADEAFDRLRRLSQDTNTKLPEVAAAVTGAADPDASLTRARG